MVEKETWVDANLRDVNCIMEWSSENNVLNFNGQPLKFHSIDRTLLRLAKASVIHPGRIVLVYPISRTEIIIPICIECFYSLAKSDRERKRVLLVSKNLSVRELYKTLKIDNWMLHEYFPLGIVGFEGDVKLAMKSKDSNLSDSSCYFLHTSNAKIIPNKDWMKRIGCLIVDTSGFEEEELSKIVSFAEENSIPTTIVFNPNGLGSLSEYYSKKKIPVWGWNTPGLKEDFKSDLDEIESNPEQYSNPFGVSVFFIKNAIQGIKRQFVEVKDESIAPALLDARKLYFDLKKIQQQSKSDVIRRANGAYLACRYFFERMLAPFEIANNECKQTLLAKSTERRVDELKRWQTLIEMQDKVVGGFFGKAVATARILQSKFTEAKNPKYEKLKEILKPLLAAKKSVIVFNHSAPLARALADSLRAEMPEADNAIEYERLIITTCDEANENRDYDVCIIFGQVSYRAEWLLVTSMSRELIFLVYPSETALLLYQYRRASSSASKALGAEARIKFMKELLDKAELVEMPDVIEEEAEETKEQELIPVIDQEQEEILPLIKDLEIDDDLAAEEDSGTAEDEIDPRDMTVTEEGEIFVKCCRIRLKGNKTLYCKPTRKLAVVKDGKKIDYKEALLVQPGNEIMIINNNVRNSLIEGKGIFKKVDRHPKMQQLLFLKNYWIEALRRGMSKSGDSVYAFLKKLNRLQVMEKKKLITRELTISLWVDGYVIGPLHPHNLKFIGMIYGDKYLTDNYLKVSQAVTRIRGIHQTLIRKLSKMALKARLKTIGDNFEDEIIDKEFDLYLEDFTDMVTIEEVDDVKDGFAIQNYKIDKILRGSTWQS